MAEQHGAGRELLCLRHQACGRCRAELAVEQTNLVSVVDQRPADREQAQRRQVIVRDAAAYRRMRHVDQKNAHALSHGGTSPVHFAMQSLWARRD